MFAGRSSGCGDDDVRGLARERKYMHQRAFTGIGLLSALRVSVID